MWSSHPPNRREVLARLGLVLPGATYLPHVSDPPSDEWELVEEPPPSETWVLQGTHAQPSPRKVHGNKPQQ
jgi:hypothetical protein